MTIKLHIAAVQFNPAVGDLKGNADRILNFAQNAPDGADLVVLPEMALPGYPAEDLHVKPFFMQSLKTEIDRIVRESRRFGRAILLPTAWTEDAQDRHLYNAALLIEDGEIRAVRKKTILPNYGVFDEKRIFTAGEEHEIAPVPFRGAQLGVLICEDMWQPGPAAALKAKGADLLIVPNGSPFESGKQDVRYEHARRRVLETELPMLYCNLVGGQDELVFDGASFAFHQDGHLILQAPQFTEHLCDLILEKTAANDPWLAESQCMFDQLDTDAAIYNALMLGLRDYVDKNGFSGVLLGLSGGVDSALVAALAADALSPERVQSFLMPSPFTSQESLNDARDLAGRLGIHLAEIPIDAPVTAFRETLAPFFTAKTPGTTYENIQARARGLMLMALSNSSGHMLLSTGNKSEMAAGYATLYGDLNGGFNPLKDVYKTQVYALCKWRNAHRPDHALGPGGEDLIPENILTKAPTAELRANQKDQDSLPPYETLDDILICLIERDMGLESIEARGHDPALVRKVWTMLDRAEYKRRQAPPGVKITERAFGRDRRYPITNRFRPDAED